MLRRHRYTCQIPLAMTHPVAQVRAERHATPQSDTVPPARASGGSPLGLPPTPAPWVRTRRRSIRRAPVPSTPQIRLPVADPSRPTSADREVAGILRPGAAPAVAGTRDSSTLHWAVSTPATRRRSARSRSEGGELQRGLAHQLQFAGAEHASAKGEGFRHAVENGAG